MNTAQLFKAMRRSWALLWMIYDILDICYAGTALPWLTGVTHWLQVMLLQLSLVMTHSCCLLWPSRRLFFALAAGLRFLENSLAPINDFLFGGIISCCFALLPSDCHSQQRLAIRVLSAQLGWTYLATALLKINPIWLSGTELFVRQHYLLAGHNWWYPKIYQWWWDVPGMLAFLSFSGLLSEALLGLGLIMIAWNHYHVKILAWPLIILAVALHVFAALTVNVWLFSAAMILIVGFTIRLAQVYRETDSIFQGK